MTKKQQVPSLTIDFSEIEGGMNVILSMAQAVQSKRLRADVLRGLKQVGHRRFLNDADGRATVGFIDHMYENNRAGMPNARLFEMVWSGSGTQYNGVIVFKKASRQIPYPPSGAHMEAVQQANNNPRRKGKTIVLSEYVWETKAKEMETQSMFQVTPMGASARRDGWIRTKPGSHAPAKRLMMEIGGGGAAGRIVWVDSYTWRNPNEGQFTGFFHYFWSERHFQSTIFPGFEYQYERATRRLFRQEIVRAKISTPARIQSPGVHMVSRGRRDLSRVGGRVRPDLVRRYQRVIGRAVLRNAR